MPVIHPIAAKGNPESVMERHNITQRISLAIAVREPMSPGPRHSDIIAQPQGQSV